MLEEYQEAQVYPSGYDSHGNSLYYNDEYTARSLTCLRLFRGRRLRFGSDTDLDLVNIASPDYPDIHSPSYALKEYIRTSFSESEIPVYIFDDHNHALFAWYEALSEGRIESGSTLYHYDDHSDAKLLDNLNDIGGSLDRFAMFTKSLDFDNFIHPAVDLGLINQFYWMDQLSDLYPKGESYVPRDKYSLGYFKTSATELDTKLKTLEIDRKKVIVDVDLDYFEWNFGGKEWEVKNIEFIRNLMARAGVITFAISPGFIEERRSIDLIRRLLKK